MITSYAQNFEDVILWRALKAVERGFYVDIGAQDPVVDSVSLSFYERGWRGVHVEPIASYAAQIRAARPDEEIIEAAVGMGEGPLTFYEFPGTGLSTGDPAIAKQHVEAGLEVREISVPLVALQNILDRNVESEIHWLKIDVEGMELAVIESWGSSPVRPWIVVVESTIPRSAEGSHEGWDPHLQRLGYEFVYFDGLNRFYVSEKHAELKTSFGPGLNYFDEFVLPVSSNSKMLAPMRQELAAREAAIQVRDAEIARLHQHIVDTDDATSRELAHRQAAVEERDAEIARLHQYTVDTDATNARRLAEQQAAIEERKAEIERLNELAHAFRGSTSWRMTALLRAIAGCARAVTRAPMVTQRSLLQHGLLWLRLRPRLEARVRRLVRLMPPVERRLIALARRSLPTIDNPVGGWTLEPDPAVLASWAGKLKVQAVR